jgi:hypothetical protein
MYGSVAVAGWLLTVERWEQFEQNWRDVLHSFNVSLLHMKDYEGGHEEFQSWLPSRKAEFMQRIVGVLRKAQPLGVSVALLKSDLDAVLTKDQQRKVSAYGICAVHAIGSMMRWVKDKGSSEPIAYVFEAGDEGGGRITDGIENARKKSPEFDKRLLSFAFEKKPNMWGLEAADFLAYEAAKQLPKKVGLDSRSPRRSLLRLLKRTEHISIHLDAEILRRILFVGGASGGSRNPWTTSAPAGSASGSAN